MNDRDLPPERIGPYRLEARLGRGGMGEVFLAFDERLERRVAIKRVRWGPRKSPHLHERFRREARAAARLNHPAIVQVYDLIADGDGDAIVMEYVLGRPLSTLIGDPILTPALAVRLAREVAEGLAHAHAAGFVHRDLKAENVMMTGAGRAKILDFGIAKLVAGGDEESLTADGAVLGTYRSMSPEQAEGGEVDERSDLFSLGVLLYEMLSGHTPFHGDHPLAILRRLVAETPAPLSVYRGNLPPALLDLVNRLLAKNREERPRSAEAVAHTLSEIEALPAVAAMAAEEATVVDGLSELPTGPLPLPPQPSLPPPSLSTLLPSLAPPPPEPAAAPILPRRLSRRALAAALGGTLLLAALAGGLLYWRGRASAAPLRVLVAPPRVALGSDPRLALAASGVREAALRGLTALQGLAPLDPQQLGGMTGTPADMARRVAADEVLLFEVVPEGELARVALHRLDGKDGQVRWADTFKVASDSAGLRALADAVVVHLRRAYRDHPPRPGTPDLAVRDEDYTAYLAIRSRLIGGRTPPQAELAQLDEIVRGSPRFLDGQLAAAAVTLSLFASTREASYLERAQKLTQGAEALDPGDPRTLEQRFKVEIAGRRKEEAAAALARFEAASPGDPTAFILRANLAELRGQSQKALDDLRTAVAHIPSWDLLRQLAELEARTSQLADARKHLQKLLDLSPGNSWGRFALAQIELIYGDPVRAEQLYHDLIASLPPDRAMWTNLGLSRFLAGRYEAAVDAYRQALALAPLDANILLNLADAEMALGRREEALGHYRQALSRFDEIERATGLTPTDKLDRALCLAHLGRTAEAAEIAQHVLQERSGEAEIVYEAALVYALVGDRTSARINAKSALRLGYGPSWFGIAAFDFLRDDPELRSRRLTATP